MPLTRDFKQTIQDRVQRDPEFREELFKEGVQCLLSGDVDTGKAILRDYINATLGFEHLSREIQIPEKSIMRMLSESGNPSTNNMALILSYLNEYEGVTLKVSG